ncbi:MAG: DoxX family protein [Flavobacteriaceae bacterium]
MTLYSFCVYLSSVSFLGYGVLYFTGTHMKQEFVRFQLKKLGLVVVVSEILGAVGLLVGFWFYKPLLIVASGGLTVLMLLGLIVRLRLKDSLWVSLPALFYMILNAYIFYIGSNQ